MNFIENAFITEYLSQKNTFKLKNSPLKHFLVYDTAVFNVTCNHKNLNT